MSILNQKYVSYGNLIRPRQEVLQKKDKKIDLEKKFSVKKFVKKSFSGLKVFFLLQRANLTFNAKIIKSDFFYSSLNLA